MKNPSLILGKVQTRFGISLMELMVVILIIGILTVISAGAVVKWMQWQKDTNNANSAGAIALNNIKDAVDRIRTDITQRARQEFTQLTTTQKAVFSKLADDLASQNNRNTNLMILDGSDPNSRALTVYTNWKIAKFFPNRLSYFDRKQDPVTQKYYYSPISFTCDYYGDTSKPNTASTKLAVENSQLPPGKMGYRTMANTSFTALDKFQKSYLFGVDDAVFKKALAAYSNVPVAASALTVEASSCLLISLTTHPKGMKEEELAGSIVNDGSSSVRYINGPSGSPIYHLLRYITYDDYTIDKNYRPGSVKVEVGYDPT